MDLRYRSVLALIRCSRSSKPQPLFLHHRLLTAVRDLQQRWRDERRHHAHKYDDSVDTLLHHSEIEADLRHHHAHLAARHHPDADADRLRATQTNRTKSASNE